MWAIRSKTSRRIRFTSLRWRIASFYAGLLIAVIAIVAFVLTIQLRSILLDNARARVDGIGTNIAQVATRNGALVLFGDPLPVYQALTTPGNLDHWASPTTYVEIDTIQSYPEAKSTNMGGANFDPPRFAGTAPVQYGIEQTSLGEMFVREELIRSPGVALIVQVGESLELYNESLRRVRELLAVVLLVAAIACGVAAYLLSASALEPIDRLIAAMREIRSDQLDRRVGWSNRSDELGQLAQTFDAMLGRLEEGFTRERQFISDASHELKTPLTIINANAQMLERWADKDAEIRSDSLRAIRYESGALARMVNGMLLLARAESGEGIPREPLALDTIVASAVEHARPRALERGLELRFERRGPAGEPHVSGDADLLAQLFTNLIENAIKFTERGYVAVSVISEGQTAVVEIADTGIGIESAAHERVFDRFYRTDKSRDRAVPGTGLGLAIVRSIARVHDGTVSAEPRPAGGTTFRVTLPALTPLS